MRKTVKCLVFFMFNTPGGLMKTTLQLFAVSIFLSLGLCGCGGGSSSTPATGTVAGISTTGNISVVTAN
jgi:hypothetical protein